MTSTKTRSRTGFSAFALSDCLQDAVAAAGFVEPRPIQHQTIPAALEGRDVLGLAQTGTGKTAAFTLPLLERLLSGPRGGPPRALVVAPTRELATQILEDTRSLARFSGLTATSVFGGVPARAQVRALRERPDVLIACPGRLLDLQRERALRLDAVEVLVLDEADHMFDMGFLPDVRRILALLPAERQNLLFSATMPADVRGLAQRLLRRPHVVELEHAAPLRTIEHALYSVAANRKVELLDRLMAREDFTSAIVFARTRHRARRLARQLERLGHRAVSLQGDMTQPQRDRAMRGFRDGRFDVLVATDIAARGIDVAGLSHVVNFDVPSTPDAYTHRIGRTGRAEREGVACTLASPEEDAALRAIERRLGAPIPRAHLEGFESGAPTGRTARRERTPAPVQRTAASRGQRSRRAGARVSRVSGVRTTASRAGESSRRSAARSPAAPFGAGIDAARGGRPDGAPTERRGRGRRRRRAG